MQLPDIELQGKHVSLRPMEPEDAAQLWAAANENTSHFGYSNVPNSLSATEEYIESALAQRENGTRYSFVIIMAGKVVGSTSYSDYAPWQWPKHCQAMQRETPDVCEVGHTWLAASAIRTACNTECKYLLFEYAFEHWCVHRVMLRTDERNLRSRKAIERVGGLLEGIKRADVPGWDGTVRNSAYYSIVTEEWPAVKAKLLALMNST